MIKIVKGKRYDTEKSKIVFETTISGEGLYITHKGNWFEFSCTKDKIYPLNREDALEWLEMYDAFDIIEQYFEIEDA